MTCRRMSLLAVPIATAFAFSMLACSSQELEPASGVVQGAPMASENGVEVRVLMDAWEGTLDVSRYATPVFVSITNHSGQRIRLEPTQFTLIAADRETYDAMPPSSIASQIDPASAYAMPDEEWRASDLHASALSEGIIGAGETRSGFLFFDKSARDDYDVKMTARFESVDTGNTVAKIALPMRR